MCGAAALSPSDPELVPRLGAAALTEAVSRYCWAFDERRRDLLADCFTEDAVWEGTVAASQTVGPLRGRDRILEWLAEFWPHQRDQRRHILTNFLVEALSEEEADVYAYLLLTSARDETVSVETTGFYRTRLALDDGRWRIRHLFAGFDAPFWPGKVENLSDAARNRHGLFGEGGSKDDPSPER
jgi:ketosteroid isomerase-like protein